MPGILADANIVGHVSHLIKLLGQEPWQEFWDYLKFETPSFADLGLDDRAVDRQIWLTCQSRELVLITANRNASGPDSLEEVLRTMNDPTKLPVLTMANPRRFLGDRTYAEKVTDKVLDYLLDLDSYRGTGRLYVP